MEKKTKEATSNVAKGAAATKNHEATRELAGKGKGQADQLKAMTATKKAVEAAKRVQTWEEKRVFSAKKEERNAGAKDC